MRSSDFQAEAARKVKEYLATQAPDAQFEETTVSGKKGSYLLLKIISGNHHVDIYSYDDGDLGFKTENNEWFPLETWDEKDEQKRIERFIKMLEQHVSFS